MSKLLIIESPAKAKTITKYLGKEYEVIASYGHIRDLPRNGMGIDFDNDFAPDYGIMEGKADQLKKIKDKIKSADTVYLATDPDREGEAISWHLSEALKLDPKKTLRITFNEITQKSITAALELPRELDLDLVDAYQARRILDRIVGYKLSPLLWKKIRRGLSAGRVQSVATRLVVDRENEIRAFEPVEYWVMALSACPADRPAEIFTAKFIGRADGDKLELGSEAESKAVLAAVENAQPIIADIRHAEKSRNPSPPFITSSLQQDASSRLGFTPKKTMMLAQNLYEGVTVSGHGSLGLITYMRTDSLRLSGDVVAQARDIIKERYGAAYLPSSPRAFKSKGSAQDAHEAIRPTYPEYSPDMLKGDLTSDQYKLYKLIWERFMACQMSPARYKTVAADLHCGGYLFRANGRRLVFPGFTALYDNDDDESEALPELSPDDRLTNLGITSEQKFTQPPARYTEAGLIKVLEENGIGRPSTYAPTISTIIDREYVEKEGRSLKSTPLGEVVTGLMVDCFNDIVDVKFTARMEQQLDAIEDGKAKWQSVIGDFYTPFMGELTSAEEKLGKERIKVPETVTDIDCELCGQKLVIKSGRFGKFMACPGWPDCKFTKPIVAETPGLCPTCGGRIVELKSKNGNKFYGCENFPKCDFKTWDVPQKTVCPDCGKPLFKRFTKDEKKYYCADPTCAYEKPIVSRGKAKADETQDDENAPAKDAKKTAAKKPAAAKKQAAKKTTATKKSTTAKTTTKAKTTTAKKPATKKKTSE